MLHNGLFSIKGTIKFENYFDYLALSSLISEGVHVMYGICCCRHATEFLYDILSIFNFNLTVQYIWVNNTTGIWRKVNPVNEKANHKVIMINNNENKYLIDPANKFILQMKNDGRLNPVNIESIDNIKLYQDSNINTVGKVLKKYYTYRELGIQTVYEYN